MAAYDEARKKLAQAIDDFDAAYLELSQFLRQKKAHLTTEDEKAELREVIFRDIDYWLLHRCPECRDQHDWNRMIGKTPCDCAECVEIKRRVEGG